MSIKFHKIDASGRSVRYGFGNHLYIVVNTVAMKDLLDRLVSLFEVPE